MYEKISAKKFASSKESFIEKAKTVHGNKYDYSKVEYKNNATKVCIICHKKDKDGNEHGEFWQKPFVHLKGRGCQKCGMLSKSEEEIAELLDANNIKYVRQQEFDWLKYKHKLQVDFYLPDYNIVIECQGIQHFKPVSLFGGEEQYHLQTQLDAIKKQLCEEHDLKILYYANFDYEFPYNVITDKKMLLTEIK